MEPLAALHSSGCCEEDTFTPFTHSFCRSLTLPFCCVVLCRTCPTGGDAERPCLCIWVEDIVWQGFFLGHSAVDHRVCCVPWITRRKLNDVSPALWRKATLGWLQNSLNRISQKKLWLLSSFPLKGGKKNSVKETWEGVSFSTDARTVCCGSLEGHIYNGAYLTPWHHQRACCVGLPHCSVGLVPLQQQQHVSYGTSEQGLLSCCGVSQHRKTTKVTIVMSHWKRKLILL